LLFSVDGNDSIAPARYSNTPFTTSFLYSCDVVDRENGHFRVLQESRVMNKVFRNIGRIVVPALAASLWTVLPAVGQTMVKSSASVSLGSDRILRDGSITEIATNTLLQIDGTMRVPSFSAATLKLDSQSLVKGSGSLTVEAGATLVIDSSQGQFGKIQVDNQGTVILKGLLDCSSGLDFETSGTLILANTSVDNSSDLDTLQANVQALYPSTGAVFTIHNGGVLTGSGVLDGDLVVEPGGKIVLTAPDPKVSAASSMLIRDSSGKIVKRKPAMPTASPDFMILNGDLSMSSASLDITINTTYYGQLSMTGMATIGNCTLNVTLSGYTPAYADAFRIIKADSMTGQFGSFNSTALNFDNRGIISITGGQAYRLSGY
jgi:hypothetical protein